MTTVQAGCDRGPEAIHTNSLGVVASRALTGVSKQVTPDLKPTDGSESIFSSAGCFPGLKASASDTIPYQTRVYKPTCALTPLPARIQHGRQRGCLNRFRLFRHPLFRIPRPAPNREIRNLDWRGLRLGGPGLGRVRAGGTIWARDSLARDCSERIRAHFLYLRCALHDQLRRTHFAVHTPLRPNADIRRSVAEYLQHKVKSPECRSIHWGIRKKVFRPRF